MLTLAILVDRSYPSESVWSSRASLESLLFVGLLLAAVWTWKRSPIGGRTIFYAALFALTLPYCKTLASIVVFLMNGLDGFDYQTYSLVKQSICTAAFAVALFLMVSGLIRSRSVVANPPGCCPHCRAELGPDDTEQCPACRKPFTIVVRYEIRRRRDGSK